MKKLNGIGRLAGWHGPCIPMIPGTCGVGTALAYQAGWPVCWDSEKPGLRGRVGARLREEFFSGAKQIYIHINMLIGMFLFNLNKSNRVEIDRGFLFGSCSWSLVGFQPGGR